MAWFTTEDLDEYLAAAEGFLRLRPAENTVPLTVAATLRAQGTRAFGEAAPLFGWWRADDGTVAGAFHETPPHPVLLAGVPQRAVEPLAEVLFALGRRLSGINARVEAAEAFAAAWQRRTGAAWQVHMRQRLYRLQELVARFRLESDPAWDEADVDADEAFEPTPRRRANDWERPHRDASLRHAS